jgi:hypothetical protein
MELIMSYKPSQSSLNDAYAKGVSDAQKGDFSPPKGDRLVDTVFAPIDALAGTPSTREVAEAKSEAYRAGHSAGSK